MLYLGLTIIQLKHTVLRVVLPTAIPSYPSVTSQLHSKLPYWELNSGRSGNQPLYHTVQNYSFLASLYRKPCSLLKCDQPVTLEVCKGCVSRPHPNTDLRWIKLYIISDIGVLISLIFYSITVMFPIKLSEHAPASVLEPKLIRASVPLVPWPAGSCNQCRNCINC